MCFDINNQINFYKKKVSATRAENMHSQTLEPFSVWLRLLVANFFCDNESFLNYTNIFIVMTDINAYYVCIECSE